MLLALWATAGVGGGEQEALFWQSSAVAGLLAGGEEGEGRSSSRACSQGVLAAASLCLGAHQALQHFVVVREGAMSLPWLLLRVVERGAGWGWEMPMLGAGGWTCWLRCMPLTSCPTSCESTEGGAGRE